MASEALLNPALADMPTVTATDLKNTFADVWDLMNAKGAVTITRHEKPKAVLISVEHFEQLLREGRPLLDELSSEFDSLLANFQTTESRKSLKSAFHATTSQLGKAAVAAARKS